MTSMLIKQQHGVTLVELMLALAIASILMLGVSSVYVSSKRGYNIQDNLSRQQENTRFSLDVLMKDLRMAGYPKTFVKDPIMTGSTQTFDGGSGSDNITIQYQSDVDCLGQPTPANSCVDDPTKRCAINQYSINGNNLQCLGNGSATADVIAEGVTDLQVEYGIDTDGSGAANKYVVWSNVATADRPKIVSVRFALLSKRLTSAKITRCSTKPLPKTTSAFIVSTPTP